MVTVKDLRVVLSGDNSKLKAALQDSESRISGLGAKTGKVLKAMSRAALLTGGAIAGIGGAGIKTAVDFETGLSKVETLLAGNVAASDEAAKAARSLSKEFGTAGGSAEILEAQYQALSAGAQDITAANRIVEQSAQLAKAGFTDTTTAVDGLTTIINAYGLSAEDATRVSDVFLATQNKGKTTVDELARNLGKAIPAAVGLGASFEEVGAAMAVLTSRGLNTELATGALKAAFVELQTPASKVNKFLEKLGGDTFPEMLAKSGSLEGALFGLSEVMAEEGVKAAELFGTEAVNAIQNLTGQNFSSFEDALGSVTDSAGATETAFATMSGTAGTAFQRLKNTADDVLLEIGEQLLPMLLAVLDRVGPAISEIAPFVTEGFEFLLETIGLVKDAALGIAEAFTAGFGDTKSILQAGAGAAKLFYEAITILGQALEPVALVLGAVLGFIAEFPATAAAFVGAIIIGKGVVAALQIWAARQAILNAVMTANPIGVIIVGIAALVAAIVWLVMNWDTVKEKTLQVWDAIKSGVGKAIDFLADLFFKFTPLGILISKWDAIKKVFKGAKDIFKEIGKDIMRGLANGIKSLVSGPVDAVKNGSKKIIDGVTGFFDMRSPSKVMAGLGENVVEGFEVGLNRLGDLSRRGPLADLRGFAGDLGASGARIPRGAATSGAGGIVLQAGAIPVSITVQGGGMDERRLAELVGRELESLPRRWARQVF